MLLSDELFSRCPELVNVLVENPDLDLLALPLAPRMEDVHPPAPLDALLVG
jgi:hypothetical protein